MQILVIFILFRFQYLSYSKQGENAFPRTRLRFPLQLFKPFRGVLNRSEDFFETHVTQQANPLIFVFLAFEEERQHLSSRLYFPCNFTTPAASCEPKRRLLWKSLNPKSSPNSYRQIYYQRTDLNGYACSLKNIIAQRYRPQTSRIGKKGKFHLHFPSLLEYVECACVLSFRLNIKIIMCDSKFGINCYCVRSGIHLFSGGRL